MRVILFNPPGPSGERFVREGRCTHEEGVWGTLWPPLSLATVAAVLREDGHEVRVIDAAASAMTADALGEVIATWKPEAALWAVATTTIRSDLALAIPLKRLGVLTGVFGTHASALPAETLARADCLDFVIRGEPELTARDVFRAWTKGGPVSLPAAAAGTARDVGRLAPAIPGLSCRDETGRIVHGPDRVLPADLDWLPFPAWDLVKLEHYRIPFRGQPFVMMTPLRGCPYACAFCTSPSYYGRRIRKFSIPRAVAELAYVKGQLGVGDVFFWSDTFTADRAYVRDLCGAMLRERLDMRWYCNSRVDTVDGELLQLMREAGCQMVSFGIESASQEILDRAGKNVDAGAARTAVEAARKAGLRVAGHFIFGLPGETFETAEETLRLALSLPLDVAQFYCAAPFPGSRFYDFAVESGVSLDGRWEDVRQDRAVIDLPGFSASEITEFRRRAYREFYLRPCAAWRTLRLVALSDPKMVFRAIARFARWAFRAP